MAFGIKREELKRWKRQVEEGEVVILTHFWEDERFPNCTSVTKVGCSDIEKLVIWGEKYQLMPQWIHQGTYPHFDLFGQKQKEILQKEGMKDHIIRFNL